MKVMKFGGTSVGSVNSILSVKRIVESASEPVIVVVSALGGITDKLINTSKMAAVGDSAYEGEFREIVYRHMEMIKEVIPAGEKQTSFLSHKCHNLVKSLILTLRRPLKRNASYIQQIRDSHVTSSLPSRFS